MQTPTCRTSRDHGGADIGTFSLLLTESPKNFDELLLSPQILRVLPTLMPGAWVLLMSH